MKKIIFVITMFLTVNVFAQSNQEGEKLLYYQKYLSAEDAFHRIISANPADAEAWMLLVKTYLLQGDKQKAVDKLMNSPESFFDSPYYMVAKGGSLYANGKIDSSRIFFDKAVSETKGKKADILANAAALQIIAGGDDMSFPLELLEKAMKRDKNNASLYVLKGNAYRNMHNGSEAYKAYQEAIGKDKDYAEAYQRLGDLFLSQKNRDMYMEYFNKAVTADNNYGPAYYDLYNYYVYTEPNIQKATEYFRKYEMTSDKTTAHDYAATDLEYLNKNYAAAINGAKALIDREVDAVQPRLYKLIAYSYADQKDSANALAYMRHYFSREADSNFVAKDYETMANLQTFSNAPDSAVAYLRKGVAISKDSTSLFNYYKGRAAVAAASKDYAEQAKWMGFYSTENSQANNVDMFNWGIAAFRAADYNTADTAFALYTQKYPEQGFGYYWRARSNAALDTAMQEGLAVPYYTQLIEKLNSDSLTESDKKWKVEALGYLAAYETNTKKDFEKAIDYFEEVLELDPENKNVKNYIGMLEANLKKEQEAAN
jgi:tetratricopeptide (TPR) repeat protein